MPLTEPLVAVTVVEVFDTVCVVSVTVAMPAPFVVDVALDSAPFGSDFVHDTACPATGTALPLASSSCAEICTCEPAIGEVVAGVRLTCVGGPACVMISWLVPLIVPVVANADEMPTWTPGDEFEAARKQAIAEAGKE